MERCVDDVVSTIDQKVQLQHIPNDLFFSILSKLSLKSLKRFECVCKSWSLLFDNPNFMTKYRMNFLTKIHPYYDDTSLLLHKKNRAPPFGGYYFQETFELYSVSNERFENKVQLDWPNVTLDRPPRSVYDSGFDILGYGSVQGTLCLICAFKVNIVLWNPSTKEFKLIPPSPFDTRSDAEVCLLNLEFGYDHVNCDYKVIRHIALNYDYMTYLRDLDVESEEDNSPLDYIWEIYSLTSNSWRKLDVDMHDQSMEERGHLYVDGLSHWICKSDTHNQTYMVSFDWSNEVFCNTTPVPSDMNYGFDCVSIRGHLVLLNGSIALILTYKETATFHISILGELGVKESWTKIFIVGLSPCLEYPIGVGNKGDILFRKKDGELAWLNLNTQMIEDLGVIMERFCCKILVHKENLLPFEGESI